jgi:cell division protein FtsW (lipid II flippase)
MAQRSSSRGLYLLAPVPALAAGVLTMRMHDVPASVWGQNLAAWIVGTLLCAGIWRPRTRPAPSRWAEVVAGLTLAALAATLLAPGLEGVHRWVALGPLRLHAASILLPSLLVALNALSRARGGWIATLVALGVLLCLFVQPDAAQATAFAAAAGVLLLPRAGRGAPWLGGILALAAGLTWMRRDPLAPVPHVEHVVGLAAELGAGWVVAALAALLLLPIPFLLAGRGAENRTGAALGTYVAITLLAPLAGIFPVPVMGYGMSPILGYLAGLGILLRTAAYAEPSESSGAAVHPAG